MNNTLKVNGIQKFMGIDIPVIEGGFGENQKVILAKTIAEIHNQPLKKINQLINDNIDEFEFGIDILDLKSGYLQSTEFLEDIMSKQSIANSSNIYLLSEQGYMLLVGFMKTEKSKEIRKKLRREYFDMRHELNEIKQQKAMLLLQIYDGGQNAISASKKLTEIEVELATAPLIAANEEMKPKAEFHDAVSIAENCISFGKFAGTFQNNNKVSFGRNKVMDWCRDNGYLCSSHSLKNKPSQQMIDSGYMKYKQNTNNRNGKEYITYTPLLTGKGEIWLTKKLLDYFDESEE